MQKARHYFKLMLQMINKSQGFYVRSNRSSDVLEAIPGFPRRRLDDCDLRFTWSESECGRTVL